MYIKIYVADLLLNVALLFHRYEIALEIIKFIQHLYSSIMQMSKKFGLHVIEIALFKCLFFSIQCFAFEECIWIFVCRISLLYKTIAYSNFNSCY